MSIEIRKILSITISALLLSACGYKPVSHYTSAMVVEPLYLVVKLSSKEPDTGLFLKDELRKAIAHRLGIRTSKDEEAPSRLIVLYNNISYTALGYDTDGYVERYRVNMTTEFRFKSEKEEFVKKIITSHEADVTQSALESSRAKQEAIKESTKKAVDIFVAFMAAKAVKNEK
ncbi:MAG: hypothetical protein HF962_04210 [Sulfurovum sp.]|nr:hypothetical protein [Sulfurovum sp.]